MTVFIDPDMAPILAAMRAAPPVDYAAMSIAEGRALFERARRALARAGADGRALRGRRPCRRPQGPLRARLYRTTPAPEPLILFVHGGGWTFGSVDTHENEMRHLALASGCAVLGFDYRLGPEHPFPAGLDDTLAALAAVRAGALGDAVDASRIALAGDSAGANLALGALALPARRAARRRSAPPRCSTAALRRTPTAKAIANSAAAISGSQPPACVGTGATFSGRPLTRRPPSPRRSKPTCAACRRCTCLPRDSIPCATIRSRSGMRWRRRARLLRFRRRQASSTAFSAARQNCPPP